MTDKTASMTGAIVSYSTRARDSRFTGKLMLPAAPLDRRQWITRWVPNCIPFENARQESYQLFKRFSRDSIPGAGPFTAPIVGAGFVPGSLHARPRMRYGLFPNFRNVLAHARKPGTCRPYSRLTLQVKSAM
jgi:hypothetical protein